MNEILQFAKEIENIYNNIVPKGTKRLSNGTSIVHIKDDLIVFGGTHNIESMVHNLDTDTNQSLNIHKGFHRMFVNILPELERNVEKLPYHVSLCGHSQGGVLALLYGLHIVKQHTHIKVRVFTFGSPMVSKSGLKSEFQKYKNLSCVNIAHMTDLVTFLPVGFETLPGEKLVLQHGNLFNNHFIIHYIESLHKLKTMCP